MGKNHISSESNNNKKEDTFICEFDHQNWVKTKGMILVHIIGEVHISICNMTDTMRTLIGLKTIFFFISNPTEPPAHELQTVLMFRQPKWVITPKESAVYCLNSLD